MGKENNMRIWVIKKFLQPFMLLVIYMMVHGVFKKETETGNILQQNIQFEIQLYAF